MSPIDRDPPAGSGLRQPPRFVPTLTDVVDWAPLAPTEVADPGIPGQPSSATPEGSPPSSDSESLVERGGALAAFPLDAVVDEVVDRALDRLVVRLTDELESHLATQLARWRNEEARAWAAAWVAEQMDQGLSGMRDQVRQLADEEVARISPRDGPPG